jgi:hypothetical protein
VLSVLEVCGEVSCLLISCVPASEPSFGGSAGPKSANASKTLSVLNGSAGLLCTPGAAVCPEVCPECPVLCPECPVVCPAIIAGDSGMPGAGSPDFCNMELLDTEEFTGLVIGESECMNEVHSDVAGLGGGDLRVGNLYVCMHVWVYVCALCLCVLGRDLRFGKFMYAVVCVCVCVCLWAWMVESCVFECVLGSGMYVCT